MRFKIKQKFFSVVNAYYITDNDGNLVYQVKLKHLRLGPNIDIFDMEDNLIANIQQKILIFSYEFCITRGVDLLAIVKSQEYGLLKTRYSIVSPDIAFDMDTNWLRRNYTITAAGMKVAEIKKKFCLVPEVYTVDIVDGIDIPTVLSVVFTLPNVCSAKYY